eukprot:gene7474-15296_t
MKILSLWSIFLTIALANAVIDEDDSGCLVLTDDNFDEALAANSILLVDFYAPWCAACQALEPEWSKSAIILESILSPAKLGKVNMEFGNESGKKYGIKQLPTVLLFRNGALAGEFLGGRTANEIVAWLKKKLSVANSENLQGDVIALYNDNYDQFMESNTWVLIDFYAPWCGHCQNLAPIWSNIAGILETRKSPVKVAKVDVNSEERIGQDNKVQGLPTIKLFHKMGKKQVVEEYGGERTAADIVNWVEEKTGLITQLMAENRIQGEVIALYTDNYDKIMKDSKWIIIDYYTPWCGHCKQLTPEWLRMAGILERKNSPVRVAKIDADSESFLAQRQNIQGYPTIKLFYEGKAIYQHSGPRTAEDLAKWVETKVAEKEKQIEAENMKIQQEKEEEEEEEEENFSMDDDVAVIELTEENFAEMLEEHELLVVDFFAPWCGHCQSLAPEWEKAANTLKTLKSTVKLGKINVDEVRTIGSKYEIQGLPTIKLFRAGVVIDEYLGDRSAAAITKWAQTKGQQESLSGSSGSGSMEFETDFTGGGSTIVRKMKPKAKATTNNRERQIQITNGYDEEIRLYYQGQTPLHMGNIAAHDVMGVNSFVGHKFYATLDHGGDVISNILVVEGVNTYKVEPKKTIATDSSSASKGVTDTTISTTNKKVESITVRVFQNEAVKFLDKKSTSVNARFRSLSSRRLDLYYNGDEPSLTASMNMGQDSSSSSYEGHEFFYTPHGDMNDVLGSFVVHKDQVLYMMHDPKFPATKEVLDLAAKEEKFIAEYKNRTGIYWRSYYGPDGPRAPPTLFMWPAQEIGQVHTVASKHGQWKCNGSAAKCQDKQPVKLELEVISQEPRAFIIKDFLSKYEADKIIELAKPSLHKSMIGESDISTAVSDTRSSRNTWIPRTKSAETETITLRAADLLQIDESLIHSYANAEDLQVVHYDIGQKYDSHHDWGVSGYPESRYITLLFYLTDMASPDAGGETAFPKAAGGRGVKVHPGKGSAVLFYNLLEDGNSDDLSLHESIPVNEGEKWLANYWIWDPERK